MKSTSCLPALLFVSVVALQPTMLQAGDTQIVGDLKVDGLYFSGDPNKTVIKKPSDISTPWTINNLDICYTTGNVGIGTPAPTQKLEVTGTVKATAFQGNGAGLTNVSASIADNSVTDAKISGTISAAKLDLSTVQKKYGKVAVVANSGGDYTDPVAAMSGLATWCGTPSASNPCMLKIMPGVYTVTAPVVMQPYVDIEGAGEKVTKLTSALSSSLNHYTVATVLGANNAEFRFLTVENTGTGTYTTAIANTSVSPSLVHVTANASGGTNGSIGFANYYSSSPTMINVTANASGPSFNYGVENYSSSSPTMTNVTATALGGTSFNYGVSNSLSSSPVMTNVTATASGETGIGISNYSSSPLMLNVTATATGTLQSIGVGNSSSSSPTMTNVIATASGGASYNHGVNNSSSSPIMINVTATATGGTGRNSGVNNAASSTTMTNVTAIASGGTKSYGVYSWSGGTVWINHSVIKGATNTINNDTGVTTFVGNTQLDGGPIYGTLTCVGAYSGTYTALNSTCQ